MPWVIRKIRGKGNRVEPVYISAGDWQTMQTALKWKEQNIWKKVKRLVYKSELLKIKKPKKSKKQKNILKKIFG